MGELQGGFRENLLSLSLSSHLPACLLHTCTAHQLRLSSLRAPLCPSLPHNMFGMGVELFALFACLHQLKI